MSEPYAGGDRLVVAAGDVGHDDARSVGVKAARLRALAVATGFPVPDGFAVTVAGVARFAASCPSFAGLAAALEGADRKDAAALTAAAGRLSAALRSTPAPADLRAAVAAALRSLGDRPLAVRSSATAEDLAGASCAGQYDTYLGVRGLEAVVARVRDCCASLYGARAVLYRARRGLPLRDVAMAVLVQEVVPAEVSGVLFTAEPVSGRRDRFVVESTWGLGETLVSGRVEPDRLVLSRPGWFVVAAATGDKRVELVLDEGGASVLRPVPACRARRPCLEPPALAQLLRLGTEAEAAFGGPQDVEWAWAGGRVVALQARPVTALRGDGPEDRQVWTNANAAELVPGVVTPLAWSFVQRFAKALIGAMLEPLGIDVRGVPILGLVGGRVYFNLNAFVALLRAFPGLGGLTVDEFVGGAQGKLGAAGRVELGDEDLPAVGVSVWRVLLRLPGLLWWLLRLTPARALQLGAAFRRRVDEVAGAPVRELGDPELRLQLDPSRFALLPEADATAAASVAAVGASCFMHLRWFCRRWLGDLDGALANRLLAAVGGVDSAESGLDLWRLSLVARERPAVAALVRRLRSSSERATWRVELAAVEGGPELLAGLDAFLARHGHHGFGQLDLGAPRWAERPLDVLSVVADFLDAEGVVDPLADRARRAADREAAEREARARLVNPVLLWVFDFLLGRARFGLAFREGVKGDVVRLVAAARARALELGRRLAERAVLGAADDVFFLDLDELETALEGGAVAPGRALVAERRAALERDRALEPPPVVLGRWDPARSAAEALRSARQASPDGPLVGGLELRGLAVSPGTAVGRARVLLHPGDGARVLPGEILVAPATDPAWAPLFLTAGGLVVDVGGLLSHGSVVAREYGLPAVVNVVDGTRRIRTGQVVRVDGTRGVVTVMESAAPPPGPSPDS